ncbi:MAG: MazG-like family protein [Anaerococcus sp.]|nr:MazG-like family protein [Anaerococcus sp.]
MTIQELIKLIEQWARDRGLDKKGTVEGQLIKTAEEVAELIIAISKNNVKDIKDAIGDVFVTLVIGNMFERQAPISDFIEFPECVKKRKKSKMDVIFKLNKDLSRFYNITRYGRGVMMDLIITIAEISKAYDLNFVECVESAYKEIADRKGIVKNGTFIKEDDLI